MKAITYNQKYFKHLLNKEMIAIDMTAGSGNDTLYLASLCKKVYSFDIQKEAIERSKKRLKDYDNVIFYNVDHQYVDNYIKETVDVVFFNLGYLPNFDSNITTTANNSVYAFEKAYDLLNVGGYISIIFYRGHKGGLNEYYAFMELFNKKHYCIIDSYHNYQSRLEPILYIIKKV